MKYKQLATLLDETGLPPEKLSTALGISNLTYRRWMKRPPQDGIPQKYQRAIAGGIYQLLNEGKLGYDFRTARYFMENNLPEYLAAAIGQFHIPAGILSSRSTNHQEKVTGALLHIGSNAKIRQRVESGIPGIRKFMSWGSEWKQRVTLLTKAVRSKRLSPVDKLVAYGALFYLILPFDLIPDSIPVFGYVDDFGILGFATAYYLKRYPELFPGKEYSA